MAEQIQDQSRIDVLFIVSSTSQSEMFALLRNN